MAKTVNVKVDFKKLVAKLNSFFKDLGKDEKLLEDIGMFSLERIRAMVRSGFSLADGKKKKLKRLSQSYIDMRMGIARYRTIGKGQDRIVYRTEEPDERLNEVDVEFFDPGLSNLTFTGQLMRALSFFKTKEKRQITVEVNDTKRKGKYEKLTNAQVAKHVADNGRPFLGLDQTGVARVKRMVQSFIRKEIIKQRLRKR